MDRQVSMEDGKRLADKMKAVFLETSAKTNQVKDKTAQQKLCINPGSKGFAFNCNCHNNCTYNCTVRIKIPLSTLNQKSFYLCTSPGSFRRVPQSVGRDGERRGKPSRRKQEMRHLLIEEETKEQEAH